MSNDANSSMIRLSVRMVDKNLPLMGSDLICRGDATLANLDSFARTRWLDDEHLSVFVPFSKWDYREEDDDSTVPKSKTVRDAIARYGEIGYMHDFGAPTEMCFYQSEQPVPPDFEMNENGKVASLSLAMASKPASAALNVPGPMDEAFPELSKNLTNAAMEMGNPVKGNNPYITRDRPFYCTIFDCGGELNSGPVRTGRPCRGMDAELADVERVTRDHYSGRMYGWNSGGDSDSGDEEDDDEITKDFSFARAFPHVEEWMLSKGKNNLIIGKCSRPGPFFRAFKGRNVLFSTEFTYLQPCFAAFEEFLKTPATKKSHKRKVLPDDSDTAQRKH